MGETDEFLLVPDLSAEGLVDYAAQIVPYDPWQAEVIAKGMVTDGYVVNPGRALDGIFAPAPPP